MNPYITIPVFARAGDGAEIRLGEITTPVVGGHADEGALRAALAAFYRGVADVLENPPDEEAPGAAA